MLTGTPFPGKQLLAVIQVPCKTIYMNALGLSLANILLEAPGTDAGLAHGECMLCLKLLPGRIGGSFLTC